MSASMAAGIAAKQIGIELTETRNSIYNRATSSASSGDQPGPIRWSNFNFPPGLNIVHLDLAELPRNAATTLRPTLWAFIATVIVLVINLINSIILAAIKEPHVEGVRVLYSLLNAILIGSLACFSLSEGYKCLALHSGAHLSRFTLAQGCLTGLMVLMATLPCSSFNGFLTPVRYDDNNM